MLDRPLLYLFSCNLPRSNMAGEFVTAEGGTTPDVVMPKKSVWRVLRENPYVFGLSAVSDFRYLLWLKDKSADTTFSSRPLVGFSLAMIKESCQA